MSASNSALLAAWSRASAFWLPRLDDPALPGLVDAALGTIAAFDLSVIFAYPSGAGPILLFDGLRGTPDGDSMKAYLNGTYLLDPFYLACAGEPAEGLYRMRDFAPDGYFESDYFKSWQVHPCISMDSGSLAEEIAYLFRLPGGAMAVFSLMRRNGAPVFSDEDLVRLRAVEPQVREALSFHWRRLGLPPLPAAPAVDRLEDPFVTFAADRLTRQQQKIVQLLLRGHSSLSVGNTLGITEGTVKTHRHAIYQRLGIGTQSELFALFVQHAAGMRVMPGRGD